MSLANQNQIVEMAEALIERGMFYVGDQKPLEACRIGFAILLAVEPLLIQVQDEGHTLQSLIADTFTFLASLVKIEVPAEPFVVMTVAAESFLGDMDPDEHLYFDDWKRIAALYRKRMYSAAIN